MRQSHDRFFLGDDSDKSGKEYKSMPALVPFFDNINKNVSAGSVVAWITPVHSHSTEGTRVAYERPDRIRRTAAWLSHGTTEYQTDLLFQRKALQ